MAEQRVQAALGGGERLGERYRLERLIGSGGMATVWRARDERLHRTVAVKVISDALAADPSWRTRFAREARTAASISHPNLVSIFDFDSGAARPYLVMEHIPGGTLAQRAAQGPLAPSEIERLASELLSAIACVHRAGILHRDIKPANVLLDRDGHARLTDFGIARLEDGTCVTQPGQVLGTLRYLAPELVRGAPPSRAADLFALGVLLRELPVAGELRPESAEALAALSAPEECDRPARAEDVLARLDSAPAGGIADPEPTTVLARSRHRTLAHGRIAAAALTALALVIALAIALPGGGGRPPRAVSGAGASQPKAGLQARLDALARAVRHDAGR
jgi:serine/threonine protein kinase